MAGNTYGKNFRITTWGESHGKAIGCIVDGCPAGLELCEEDIQKVLDRRIKNGELCKTDGASEKREEPDKVQILSGVFEGRTTGTAISLLIENKDVRSEDYEEIKNVYRPGHADYTYDAKYGFRDYRGGGRSSGRETAARVAGGAIALKILKGLGIEVNVFAFPCGDFHEDDSVGGVVECSVKGVPKGIGEPVFDKLDAQLAGGVMSIGGVKAVEFGIGTKAAYMQGSKYNDRFIIKKGREGDCAFADVSENGEISVFCQKEDNTCNEVRITKETNNAGGVLGGISDGDEIFFRVYLKPTPSIGKKQKTVNSAFEEVDLKIKGRHDRCIAYKAAIVVETMTAITLVDLLFENMSSKIENIIKFYR